jgi:hypothetical protein
VILFFSSDEHFFDRMDSHYSNFPSMKEIEVKRFNFKEELVVDKLKYFRPYAVIFDFSILPENLDLLFMKLNFLKKVPDYKSIPFIGLFPSKSELEEKSYLFSLGLNYPFIKGSDEKILFSDIHYMAFESETPFSKFAKAKLNNLAYEGKNISTIYGYTENSILVETDLFTTEEKLRKVSLDFSGEEKVLEVRSQNNYELGITGTYLYRSAYEVPFLGPWDEPTENLILKDSYESWLEENDDLFKQKLGRALIVSNRPDDFLLAGELTALSNFDIYCTSSFEETKAYLESYKFDLIFYRLDKDEDEDILKSENNFENLYRLTNSARNLGREDSIFVAFNSPSRTEALRKALEYEQVMSVSEDLDKNRFFSLISVFENKGRKMSCETYCYAPFLKEASCFFHINMHISSITEHEITFFSEADLPMYSMLKIDVPSDLYLIVVPPITQLEIDKKGNHYMAFIVGQEESDAELLRTFVNRAIVKGLKLFSTKELEVVDERGEELLKDIEGELIENLDSQSCNLKSEKNSRKSIIRKTNHNGKSKL